MSNLTLSDLEPGTLATIFGGRLAIVVDHKPSNPKNPVIYQMAGKVSGTLYKGPVSDFRAVVGLVDLDALKEAQGASGAPPKRDNHVGTDEPCLVPDKLKGIKIGDSIRIIGRRGPEVVTYDGYNMRRPKYPVSFTMASGRKMKGGVSLVIGKAS